MPNEFPTTNTLNKEKKVALSDIEAIDSFLEGNSRSFDILYLRYKDKIISFFQSRFSFDNEEANDLMDTTFLLVSKKLASLKDKEKFEAWLFTIARNLALSKLRSSKRNKTVLDADLTAHIEKILDSDDGDFFSVENQGSVTGEDLFLSKELNASLVKAIDKLTTGYKEVARLRILEEKTEEETAQALGLDKGTVKSNLFKARRQLKELLKDNL